MNIATNIVAAPVSAWVKARTAYLEAKSAEDEYDRAVYMPQFARLDATGVPMDPEVEAEMERLTNARGGVEDVFMDIPAPDASGFAFKFMIARGAGRECDGYDDLLESEARRFVESVTNQHREWFAERDRQLTIANKIGGLSEKEAQPFIDAADALEERIISTPATDRDGVMVKALLAAALASVEHKGSVRAAEIAFAEARALGMIEFAS